MMECRWKMTNHGEPHVSQNVQFLIGKYSRSQNRPFSKSRLMSDQPHKKQKLEDEYIEHLKEEIKYLQKDKEAQQQDKENQQKLLEEFKRWLEQCLEEKKKLQEEIIAWKLWHSSLQTGTQPTKEELEKQSEFTKLYFIRLQNSMNTQAKSQEGEEKVKGKGKSKK